MKLPEKNLEVKFIIPQSQEDDDLDVPVQPKKIKKQDKEHAAFPQQYA